MPVVLSCGLKLCYYVRWNMQPAAAIKCSKVSFASCHIWILCDNAKISIKLWTQTVSCVSQGDQTEDDVSTQKKPCLLGVSNQMGLCQFHLVGFCRVCGRPPRTSTGITALRYITWFRGSRINGNLRWHAAVCAETTASQNENIDQAVVGQCGGCE